jgi:hypothetical protein
VRDESRTFPGPVHHRDARFLPERRVGQDQVVLVCPFEQGVAGDDRDLLGQLATDAVEE